MKKLLYILLAVGLVGCNSSKEFHINGKITNAAKKEMYLDHIGMAKTTPIDSVKLSSSGEYTLKGKRPAYPDFYRLRLNNQTIDFAVDSCESITINSDAKNFATKYNVEGSPVSNEIKKLRLSVHDIQEKVDKLTPEMAEEKRQAIITNVESDIKYHKQMAEKLILMNPKSPAAYYAIYQKINNSYIFSPYVKSDKPYCAAVATSYNTYMPNYVRSKNLYALVMDAINKQRKEEENQQWENIINKDGKGYIDIQLDDRNGHLRKLSDLEGKVILLDFNAYSMDDNVQYTFALRDLYNKYHNRGFEIYQVSLDQSKILWQDATANIPWICVHDDNGPHSKIASMYNVHTIPTHFLINKKGNIINRNLDFKSLSKLIAKNL